MRYAHFVANRFLIAFIAAAAALLLPQTAAAENSALGCSMTMPAGALSGPAVEAQIVTIVNEHRVSMGLSALKADPRLDRAATWKARDLIAREELYTGLIPHNDPGRDGRPHRTPGERAMTCGHTNEYAYENLMASFLPLSARDVVNGWLASPGHRANIENPEWQYVGTGTATSVREYFPGQPRTWYSQMFSQGTSPARPSCGIAIGTARLGNTINVDALLCAPETGAQLLGAAPALGALTGMSYAAPTQATGRALFKVVWPDTGVTQVVEIYTIAPRPAATLARPVCKGASCTFAWSVRRSEMWANVQLQIQRRLNGRWVKATFINLSFLSDAGKTSLRLKPGSYRARVTVRAGRNPQAAATAWRPFVKR